MMKRLLAVSIIAFAAAAQAQSYPSKPIRLVVGFPPGGGMDLSARVYAAKLQEPLGVPIVVENRPGATGIVAGEVVAKAAPDGYTLLVGASGQMTINPVILPKHPYDTVRDFAAVTTLAQFPMVIAVNPAFPAKSLAELIALAKAKPGAINYGSTGTGAPPHLLGELLKSDAGIDLLHVPYKGDAPLTQALLAGEVQVAFMPLAGVLPHIRSGRLRALGVSGKRRSAEMPDVPTFAEAGLPFEFTGWLAIFAPAGVPRELAMRLQREIAKAIVAQDLLERWPAWGYEPVGSTPEEFAARLSSDMAMYAKVIRDAGIPSQD
jgi:tripartite-type tricarboxylate transporter receptor subunit TctC